MPLAEFPQNIYVNVHQAQNIIALHLNQDKLNLNKVQLI
jgi:hypothetical protein